MRPYVPREDPTEASRPAPRGEETRRPADPEEVLADLQRKQRRRRAAVIAMSLAALMIGGAVLLDRDLVKAPTGVSAFGNIELPELENTWVGKALDEARQARDAEAGPRGVIRPLVPEAGSAQDDGARTPGPAAPSPPVQEGLASAPLVRTPPTSSASPPPTRRGGEAGPDTVRSSAAATPAGRQRAAAAPGAPRDRGPNRPTAAATAPSSDPQQGAVPGPEEGTTVAAPTGGLTSNGTVPAGGGVEIISSLEGVAGGEVIAVAGGEAEDADAFYEDTGTDDAALDPERFRPRRPWPVPTGSPPAGGSVGSFSLVSLPPAEVRFREHPLGSTPLYSQQLPSGRQRLILVGPDGVRRVLILDVHADEHAEIQLPLSRLMPEALMP